MTRYAKLTGRKPQLSKSSAEETADTDERQIEGVKQQVELPVSDECQDQSRDGDGDAERRELTAKEGVKKLLKSLKLLKLKAKKTTSEKRKQELLSRIRLLQTQVQDRNGQRGGEGKRDRTASRSNVGQMADTAESVGNDRTNASEGITNPWKAMEAERRAKASERSAHRREKRIEEREAAQRCFACRQLGHSAKYCEKLPANAPRDSNDASIVHCYRCGSSDHSLAKCRKPASKSGPELPFAHCFICQQRGHLASKCAENKGRGIYPHGGHCKLCRSVEHLAKDCPLDEIQRTHGNTAASNASLGWTRANGKSAADEDDFHALSRQRIHLDRSERKVNRDTDCLIGASKRRKIVSF